MYYNEDNEDYKPSSENKFATEDLYEEEESEDDSRLMNNMDDDLAEYFSDARMLPKKTSSTTMKKKKNKVVFKTGDKIECKEGTGSILYGPYDVDTKKMYEIELDNGNIISIDEKHISKK